MTNQELHALVQKIAPALATLTGQDWRYVAPDEVSHWAHIQLGSGEDVPTLSIQHSGRDNKLVVTGNYPRDYGPYGDRRPSCGVSDSKSIELIARDIGRRLLPDYLPIHAKALEAKRRDMENRGKGLLVAEAIAKLLGEEWREYNGGWVLIRYGNPSIRADVDPYAPDRRVRLTLDDLTGAEAEAVLGILPATLPKEG